MINSYYFHGDDTPAQDLSPTQIRAATADPAGVLWIDLEQPTRDESRRVLQDAFGFHSLSVEAALGAESPPQFEDFGRHLFVVVRSPTGAAPGDASRETTGIAFWLGANFLVTCHDAPIAALTEWRAAVAQDARLLAPGADLLAVRCTDLVLSATENELDETGRELADLEAGIFRRSDRDTVRRLFAMRKRLWAVQTDLDAQIDVFEQLASRDLALVQAENRLYYRAARDRLLHVRDRAHRQHDLAVGALDAYQAVVSAQVRGRLRWLNVLLVVFLLLALLAVVYVWSVFDLPPLDRYPHGAVEHSVVAWWIAGDLPVVIGAVFSRSSRNR